MFAKVDDASRGTGINCTLSTDDTNSNPGSNSTESGEIVSAVCVQTMIVPLPSLPTLSTGGSSGNVNAAPVEGGNGNNGSGNWTAGQWGGEGGVMTTTVTYAASQIQFDELVLSTALGNGTNGTVGGVTTSTTFTTTTAGGGTTDVTAGKYSFRFLRWYSHNNV
jgi:hypothetical protein